MKKAKRSLAVVLSLALSAISFNSCGKGPGQVATATDAHVDPTPITTNSESIREFKKSPSNPSTPKVTGGVQVCLKEDPTDCGYYPYHDGNVYLLFPSADTEVQILDGYDELEVRIEAQAQTDDEIQAFAAASTQDDDGKVFQIGDLKTRCQRDYEDGELKAIHGVCLQRVIVGLPESLRPTLMINGIPAKKDRKITTDELLMGLDLLAFDHEGSQKKRLVEEFLARGQIAQGTLDNALIQRILGKFQNYDQEKTIEDLLRKPVPMASQGSPQLNILHYDLRDLVEYAPDEYPEARTILDSMEKFPSSFFPAGVGLSDVALVELDQAPTRSSAHLTTFVLGKKKLKLFRKLKIELADDGSIARVQVLKDIPLSQCEFSVQAGLVQRKAILEDRAHRIKIIYPIAVGGFDPGLTPLSRGKTRLNTPRFSRATLRRSTMIAARTFPSYYRGLPFIPISRADGVRTPFSFHIMQYDSGLTRGFVSHGCMHLRERDLLALFAIIRWGKLANVPVDVNFQIRDPEDHPFPLVESYYFQLRNCAMPWQKPRTCRDESIEEANLMAMDEISGKPPVEKLDGFSTDETNFDFEPSR